MSRLTLFLLFNMLSCTVRAALPSRGEVDGWLNKLGASDSFDASKGIDWGVMLGPFYTPELGLGSVQRWWGCIALTRMIR